MQVLVKNPFAKQPLDSGLVESYWDPDCFLPGQTFSMSSLVELSDFVGLSPYYFLDSRVALMLSLLNRGSVFVKGMGPLGSLAAIGRAGTGFTNERIDKYVSEYFPSNPLERRSSYDQVLVFDEEVIDSELWNLLRPGGFYIYGSMKKRLHPPEQPFEAFGKLYPVGSPTEFGWKFEDLEISKIKKL